MKNFKNPEALQCIPLYILHYILDYDIVSDFKLTIGLSRLRIRSKSDQWLIMSLEKGNLWEYPGNKKFCIKIKLSSIKL